MWITFPFFTVAEYSILEDIFPFLILSYGFTARRCSDVWFYNGFIH